MNPAEQTGGGVLSKRHTSFALLDGKVGMFNECRRKNDHTSRWKFDAELQIPQDKVTTLLRIELPNRKDRAAAVHNVEVIRVPIGRRLGPKVEMGTAEH